ncbi:hypothetical protein Q8A67_000066 [Cirrhinus molitorella]|uniref:HECT domain-containing protein n=1 Tax=Cirrhinus molitorella TaxID=172907 RepID=A0AA88QC11_9TELE|nr:hypothetical protein Q8A67_000066 [Cirrhinus molitorella]
MEGPCGGWLLHKATGGSGRRKLIVIPPEAEGYSAKTLKSVSSGGKAIFYIMPLQETLDTSPLAPDSPHFSKMPKTTCYQCSEVMPLQMSAVHFKTCIGKLSSDDDLQDQFKLCVDREDLPERGIIQWKRKKTASPASLLKVVYIGESGIDNGALRKEFLTDMISGIENRFFEGTGTQGKNPKYSITDLDENFRIVGEIFAVSLAQGGPAPAFLREWCYNSPADADSLMMLADEIVSCGYTSQIKLEQKESIIRSIVLHSTTRLIPILQQLKNGMQYGLVDQLRKNPEPDADFIMMNCQPRYSEKGISKERTERKLTNFLQDFLQELEVAAPHSTDKQISGLGLGPEHVSALKDSQHAVEDIEVTNCKNVAACRASWSLSYHSAQKELLSYVLDIERPGNELIVRTSKACMTRADFWTLGLNRDMESTIGNGCFQLIERIAESKRKDIHIVDLYTVPTWLPPNNCDPMLCLPVLKPTQRVILYLDSKCAETPHGFGSALYIVLDAPFDYTILDMAELRKWWCIMLMENIGLERCVSCRTLRVPVSGALRTLAVFLAPFSCQEYCAWMNKLPKRPWNGSSVLQSSTKTML